MTGSLYSSFELNKGMWVDRSPDVIENGVLQAVRRFIYIENWKGDCTLTSLNDCWFFAKWSIILNALVDIGRRV